MPNLGIYILSLTFVLLFLSTMLELREFKKYFTKDFLGYLMIFGSLLLLVGLSFIFPNLIPYAAGCSSLTVSYKIFLFAKHYDKTENKTGTSLRDIFTMSGMLLYKQKETKLSIKETGEKTEKACKKY